MSSRSKGRSPGQRIGLLVVLPFLVAHYGFLLGLGWLAGAVSWWSPATSRERHPYQTVVLATLPPPPGDGQAPFPGVRLVTAQMGSPWVTSWPVLARAYARFLRAVARVSPAYVTEILCPGWGSPARGMSFVVVDLRRQELPPFPDQHHVEIESDGEQR